MADFSSTRPTVTDEQLRHAGFTGSAREHPRDRVALMLLCAFVGVDPDKAPPAWWFHPNPSTRDAWKRVADMARAIYSEPSE